MRKFTIHATLALIAVFALGGVSDVSSIIFPDHTIHFDLLSLLGTRVEAVYVPSVIKSIQNRAISIAGSATTGTDTYSAVTLTNTVLTFNGVTNTSSGNTPDQFYALITLSGTTATATRNNGTGTDNIKYSLIEYRPGVLRSVERGSQAVNGTSLTYTASLVTTLTNINKATVTVIGQKGDGNAWAVNFQNKVEIASTTQLTISSGDNGGGLGYTLGYQVVEFF